MHEFTFEGSGIRSEQQGNEVLLLARPHTHVKCGPCHFGVYLTHRLVTPWPTHPSQLHTGLVLPFTHAPSLLEDTQSHLPVTSRPSCTTTVIFIISSYFMKKILENKSTCLSLISKKPLKYIYFIFKSKLRNYLWRLILTWFCRTQKMATKV